MSFVHTSTDDGIATVTMSRGKVNAINEALCDELAACFADLATDSRVKAVILTGQGSFFSYGLDIPEFLGYSKESFTRFVTKFAELYTAVFLHPKPVIGALNGHTIAGGCMLATACDYRLMVSGKARIGLNEITFGSSLFPGSAEMLRHCVGDRTAELIAYTGRLLSAQEAEALGLVHQVASADTFDEQKIKVARDFAQRPGPAFAGIKSLLRVSTGKEMKRKDDTYRTEMVDIWYSEDTWKKLQQIKIHP